MDRKETTSRVSMKREKRDAGETKRILDDILRDDVCGLTPIILLSKLLLLHSLFLALNALK